MAEEMDGRQRLLAEAAAVIYATAIAVEAILSGVLELLVARCEVRTSAPSRRQSGYGTVPGYGGAIWADLCGTPVIRGKAMFWLAIDAGSCASMYNVEDQVFANLIIGWC